LGRTHKRLRFLRQRCAHYGRRFASPERALQKEIGADFETTLVGSTSTLGRSGCFRRRLFCVEGTWTHPKELSPAVTHPEASSTPGAFEPPGGGGTEAPTPSPGAALKMSAIGHEYRNGLPSVAAIDPEIVIEGEDGGACVELGHANEAGIGE